jgi:histidine triad (HIT) family protein
MSCIFCKIAKKEIYSYMIDETENFVAVLDINPHAPMHTMIIPKEHIENFVDLPEEYGIELLKFMKYIIKRISEKLNTKDFTIGINEGKNAGRAIDHLHIHIIPRFKNDKGGSIHSVVYNPPKEPLEKIYKILKNED